MCVMEVYFREHTWCLFVVGASQPPERTLSGDLARPKPIHIHLIGLVYDPKQSASEPEVHESG